MSSCRDYKGDNVIDGSGPPISLHDRNGIRI